MPARLPTEVLKLRGTYRKQPARLAAREGEPTECGPLPEAPAHLRGVARECWDEIARLAYWLRDADAPLVEQTAQLWAMQRAGIETMNGQQLRQLAANLGRLGMTPVDRSRVNVHPTTGKPVNRFAALGE